MRATRMACLVARSLPVSTVTPVYTLTLSGREEIAEGTTAFYITKPADFQWRCTEISLDYDHDRDGEVSTRVVR
jgi:hypothetical protein